MKSSRFALALLAAAAMPLAACKEEEPVTHEAQPRPGKMIAVAMGNDRFPVSYPAVIEAA